MSTDTNVTLKDGLNNNLVMRVRTFDDGTNAFYHVIDDRLAPATNRGGSITSANTSQQIAAGNANRTKFTFQNISDTTMYLSEDGNAASAASYKVAPGSNAESNSSMSISVFCTVAGKLFAASEFIRA